MRTDLRSIVDCLEKTPEILIQLLDDIPKAVRHDQRRKGKWSIHENACHLAQAEVMIHDRFRVFEVEARPVFEPYIPGETFEQDLRSLDLEGELVGFQVLRAQTVDQLRQFTPDIWAKSATHPQYRIYNPGILARHTLMHDHLHMYRMEELWLSHDEYL
ncbi:MAG: DinB family protein [Bacteroidota bacterium]